MFIIIKSLHFISLHTLGKAKIFFLSSFILCFVLIKAQVIHAQQSGVLVVNDSTMQSDKSPRIKEHSPTKATLLSLVPGFGQAYNKQYWKMPVIYAAMGVVTYFAIDNYNGYTRLRKEYLARLDNQSLDFENPRYKGYSTISIGNLMEAYQSNFELSLIIGGVIYVINLIDANVYAHLFSFNVNDDLALQMSPVFKPLSYCNTKFSYETGLSLRIKFK